MEVISFEDFARQMWMEANLERECYSQESISYDDYYKEYKEFLFVEYTESVLITTTPSDMIIRESVLITELCNDMIIKELEK